MKIKTFYDERTFTLTYVVHDEPLGLLTFLNPYRPLAMPAGFLTFSSALRVAWYLSTNMAPRVGDRVLGGTLDWQNACSAICSVEKFLACRG